MLLGSISGGPVQIFLAENIDSSVVLLNKILYFLDIINISERR
jgi:hypothetical protein